MDDWECIVGGTFTNTGVWHTVVNPFNGKGVARVSQCGQKEISDALLYATRGAKEVASLPAHARSAILHRLASLMEESREEFIALLIAEGGKPRRNAEGEVGRAIETIRISAEETVRIQGEVIPLDRTFPGTGKIGIVQRFPVGIVLAITPFNFPLNLACHKLGPAVAAGNAIILKPASATPLSSILLGKLLLLAGYPPQAVSVLVCTPENAEKLATSPQIGCISFTGSPDVGWHLRSVAACGRVSLELGGNAAVIVHDDCDVSYAAGRIVEGAFSQAGQVCISVQRVYVHKTVYEILLKMIGDLCDQLIIGDPQESKTNVGPMISAQAAQTAMKRISDACTSGATVFRGGVLQDALLHPTILTGTLVGMEVNCREIFAPVVTISQYESFEEAVTLVNDSVYGLQAGVFTRDIGRARYAFSHLQVGAVIIGDIPTFRVDAMPYGGIKRSGHGREGPRYAIEEMTELRMMVLGS